MAITLADFSKIWASTSPLTPYSFSDANYQEGWNFVGATPPSRQMWDYLQKNNDEKMQYLANNYLPLSGGTMTGELVFGSGTGQGHMAQTGEYFRIAASNFAYAENPGAGLILRGRTATIDTGAFALEAKSDSGNKELVGKPDGTLTWDGNNVMTNPIAGLGARQIKVYNNRQAGTFTLSEPTGEWGMCVLVAFTSPTEQGMNRIFMCRGYWTGAHRTSYYRIPFDLDGNTDGLFTVAVAPDSDSITFTVTSIGSIWGVATVLAEASDYPVTFTWTPA